MLRGFIRDTKRLRAAKQEAALTAAGVSPRVIYRDDLAAAVRSCRAGDVLAVGGGLHVLADNRRDIRKAVDAVHARGSVVMDAATGRRTDKDGVGLLDDAAAAIQGMRTMAGSAQAVEMQRKSVRVRTKGRMPQREALAIWRDPKLSTAEAVSHMTGWSQTSAYRVLGLRDVPAGRRGKKD